MGTLFRDPLKRSALLLALLAELPVSTLAGDAFVVEWQAPSPQRPWLSKLEVLPYSKNAALETEKLPASAQFPNGLRVKLSKQGRDPAWVQVKLSSGLGFLVSDRMLDDYDYLWIRDLGIFVTRFAGWAETARQRSVAAEHIASSYTRPFVSCSEKYF